MALVLDRSVPWTRKNSAEIKERPIPFMVSECGHGITRVYFMLTNIMDESSDVIYYGEGKEEWGKSHFSRNRRISAST